MCSIGHSIYSSFVKLVAPLLSHIFIESERMDWMDLKYLFAYFITVLLFKLVVCGILIRINTACIKGVKSDYDFVVDLVFTISLCYKILPKP